MSIKNVYVSLFHFLISDHRHRQPILDADLVLYHSINWVEVAFAVLSQIDKSIENKLPGQ